MNKHKKPRTLDYAYIVDDNEKNSKIEVEDNVQVPSEELYDLPDQEYNKNLNSNSPNFKYKRFQEFSEKEDNTTNSKIKLPKFLHNLTNKNNQPPKDFTKAKVDNISGEPGKVFSFNKINEENEPVENLNSIGSIFNSDHEQISGLRRVFKKSLTFLAIHSFLFFILTLVGLNFFKFNIFFNLLIFFLSLSFTNIFYIIVADRSYIWVSILAQLVLLIFTNSFVGLAFSPITLVFILLILLLSYLAYSELEKVQLSSRLFSISHITSEGTRILLTSSILIICLGIFNGMMHEGSSNFVDRTLLKNNLLIDSFLIGENAKLATNYYLMGGKFSLNAENQIVYFDRNTNKSRQATYADFLTENYQSISVLTQKEEKEIRNSCGSIDVNTSECDKKVKEEVNKRLETWKQLKYKQLETDYNLVELDTRLELENFRYITRAFYINQINDLENTENNNANALIPVDFLPIKISDIVPMVIPATISIVVFFVFTIFRFLVNWISLIFTWVIWKILVWAGFVNIDIETVEAEIVSI
jgi:hypothetical protein